MPPPLEQLLMTRCNIRYREAHLIVLDARDHLGMPPNGPWTQELQDECLRIIDNHKNRLPKPKVEPKPKTEMMMTQGSSRNLVVNNATSNTKKWPTVETGTKPKRQLRPVNRRVIRRAKGPRDLRANPSMEDLSEMIQKETEETQPKKFRRKKRENHKAHKANDIKFLQLKREIEPLYPGCDRYNQVLLKQHGIPIPDPTAEHDASMISKRYTKENSGAEGTMVNSAALSSELPPIYPYMVKSKKTKNAPHWTLRRLTADDVEEEFADTSSTYDMEMSESSDPWFWQHQDSHTIMESTLGKQCGRDDDEYHTLKATAFTGSNSTGSSKGSNTGFKPKQGNIPVKNRAFIGASNFDHGQSEHGTSYTTAAKTGNSQSKIGGSIGVLPIDHGQSEHGTSFTSAAQRAQMYKNSLAKSNQALVSSDSPKVKGKKLWETQDKKGQSEHGSSFASAKQAFKDNDKGAKGDSGSNNNTNSRWRASGAFYSPQLFDDDDIRNYEAIVVVDSEDEQQPPAQQIKSSNPTVRRSNRRRSTGMDYDESGEVVLGTSFSAAKQAFKENENGAKGDSSSNDTNSRWRATGEFYSSQPSDTMQTPDNAKKPDEGKTDIAASNSGVSSGGSPSAPRGESKTGVRRSNRRRSTGMEYNDSGKAVLGTSFTAAKQAFNDNDNVAKGDSNGNDTNSRWRATGEFYSSQPSDTMQTPDNAKKPDEGKTDIAASNSGVSSGVNSRGSRGASKTEVRRSNRRRSTGMDCDDSGKTILGTSFTAAKQAFKDTDNVVKGNNNSNDTNNRWRATGEFYSSQPSDATQTVDDVNEADEGKANVATANSSKSSSGSPRRPRGESKTEVRRSNRRRSTGMDCEDSGKAILGTSFAAAKQAFKDTGNVKGNNNSNDTNNRWRATGEFYSSQPTDATQTVDNATQPDEGKANVATANSSKSSGGSPRGRRSKRETDVARKEPRSNRGQSEQGTRHTGNSNSDDTNNRWRATGEFYSCQPSDAPQPSNEWKQPEGKANVVTLNSSGRPGSTGMGNVRRSQSENGTSCTTAQKRFRDSNKQVAAAVSPSKVVRAQMDDDSSYDEFSVEDSDDENEPPSRQHKSPNPKLRRAESDSSYEEVVVEDEEDDGISLSAKNRSTEIDYEEIDYEVGGQPQQVTSFTSSRQAFKENGKVVKANSNSKSTNNRWRATGEFYSNQQHDASQTANNTQQPTADTTNVATPNIDTQQPVKDAATPNDGESHGGSRTESENKSTTKGRWFNRRGSTGMDYKGAGLAEHLIKDATKNKGRGSDEFYSQEFDADQRSVATSSSRDLYGGSHNVGGSTKGRWFNRRGSTGMDHNGTGPAEHLTKDATENKGGEFHSHLQKDSKTSKAEKEFDADQRSVDTLSSREGYGGNPRVGGSTNSRWFNRRGSTGMNHKFGDQLHHATSQDTEAQHAADKPNKNNVTETKRSEPHGGSRAPKRENSMMGRFFNRRGSTGMDHKGAGQSEHATTNDSNNRWRATGEFYSHQPHDAGATDNALSPDDYKTNGITSESRDAYGESGTKLKGEISKSCSEKALDTETTKGGQGTSSAKGRTLASDDSTSQLNSEQVQNPESSMDLAEKRSLQLKQASESGSKKALSTETAEGAQESNEGQNVSKSNRKAALDTEATEGSSVEREGSSSRLNSKQAMNAETSEDLVEKPKKKASRSGSKNVLSTETTQGAEGKSSTDCTLSRDGSTSQLNSKQALKTETPEDLAEKGRLQVKQESKSGNKRSLFTETKPGSNRTLFSKSGSNRTLFSKSGSNRELVTETTTSTQQGHEDQNVSKSNKKNVLDTEKTKGADGKSSAKGWALGMGGSSRHLNSKQALNTENPEDLDEKRSLQLKQASTTGSKKALVTETKSGSKKVLDTENPEDAENDRLQLKQASKTGSKKELVTEIKSGSKKELVTENPGDFAENDRLQLKQASKTGSKKELVTETKTGSKKELVTENPEDLVEKDRLLVKQASKSKSKKTVVTETPKDAEGNSSAKSGTISRDGSSSRVKSKEAPTKVETAQDRAEKRSLRLKQARERIQREKEDEAAKQARLRLVAKREQTYSTYLHWGMPDREKFRERIAAKNPYDEYIHLSPKDVDLLPWLEGDLAVDTATLRRLNRQGQLLTDIDALRKIQRLDIE